MRDKAAKVVRHQLPGLTDAHAGRLLTDDPASQHRVIAAEGRKFEQLLVDIPLLTILSSRGINRPAIPHDVDVGAFP